MLQLRTRGTLVGLIFVGALGHAGDARLDEELPPVYRVHCATDVWPDWDLEMIQSRTYEFEAWETFGKEVTRPPLLDVLEPRRCVAFKYNESLVAPTQRFLTVFVESERLQGAWLDATVFSHPECQGAPHDLVDAEHHAHARACWE